MRTELKSSLADFATASGSLAVEGLNLAGSLVDVNAGSEERRRTDDRDRGRSHRGILRAGLCRHGAVRRGQRYDRSQQA